MCDDRPRSVGGDGDSILGCYSVSNFLVFFVILVFVTVIHILVVVRHVCVCVNKLD